MTNPPLEIRRHLSCCGKTLLAHPETYAEGWEGVAHAARALDAQFTQHKDTCPTFQVDVHETAL